MGAIVRKSEVVRFVARRSKIELIDDLAVLRRILVYVDYCQEIVVLRVGIDAEHVENLFRPIQTLDERRQARFRINHGQTEHGDEARRQNDSQKHEAFLLKLERNRLPKPRIADTAPASNGPQN